MRLVVLSVAMLATVGAASAATESEILDTIACLSQPSEDAQLACVAELEAGRDPFEKIATGRWRVSVSKNPLDDSKIVIAALSAAEGANRFGERVQLYTRCRSNKTEAYIVWGGYLGNDSGSFRSEWKAVTSRIGEAKAKTERWSLSSDSKGTFVPGWAGNFLKEITTADKLVVQTTPYNESPVTAIFNTRGAKEAFKELSETCGWSIDDPSKNK